jgi:hypothetical protein
MARKTSKKSEATEMSPENGAKPVDDPSLNSAVNAVEEEAPAADPAEETTDRVAKAPQIQPAGNFPTAEDAYADMSQPPPSEPLEYAALNHGASVPQDAFRVIPQSKYISLHMFNLPFGTAMPGEAFVQPVAHKILDQFRKECPQLKLKRFEIRLLQRADGSFYFLEVPADPEPTVKAEATRQSLLRTLQVAEKKWIIAVKTAGVWGHFDSPCPTTANEPHQSYKQLVDLTYGDAIHRDMNRPVLQRYRRKI